MTDAELLELSFRCRLYRSSVYEVTAFSRAQYVNMFNKYSASSNSSNIVMICRWVGEPFFWHPMPSLQDGPHSNLPPIVCINDEWAQDLLTKLRVDQVLDALSRI